MFRKEFLMVISLTFVLLSSLLNLQVGAALPSDNQTPSPTPETSAEMDITVDFVTTETERFMIKHPEEWFADALAGLGFLATDESLQETWYTEQGPLLEEGAAVIAFVGSREELDISSEDSALDAIAKFSDDAPECEIILEPEGLDINELEAARIGYLCPLDGEVQTILINVLVLRDERAASLVGLIPSELEDEYLPLIEAIIDTFQFKEW